MKRYWLLLVAATLAAVAVAQTGESDAARQLKAATNAELVNGDLKGAIKQYAAIAARYAKTDRAAAAMALVHMGECYEKLGSNEAHTQYDLVISKFADQKDAVAQARAHLAAEAATTKAGDPVRRLVCSDCQGSLSPDGRSLLSAIGAEVTILDLATHESKVLAEPVAGMRYGHGTAIPSFSPDGSRIAYTVLPEGRFTGSDTEAIEVVNANGSGRRTVYRGAAAYGWSPDGKRLLAESFPEGKAYIVSHLLWINVATGAAQELPTEHPWFDVTTVSPDGRYVAFNASKDGKVLENVYLMASDGSGETVLAPSAAYQEPVGWTPDGKYLLYEQEQDDFMKLWALAIANGRPQGEPIDLHTEMDQKTGFFEYVNQSGALVYTSLASDPYVYTATLDPVSGKATSAPALAPLARTGSDGQPRWSPDSRQLAYEWTPDPRNGIRQPSIHSFDSGDDKQLAVKVGSVMAYCWSSDGGSILLNALDEQNHPVASRYDLAIGKVSPLFTRTPAFSIRSCAADTAVGFTSSGLEVRSLSNGSAKEIYKTRDAGIFPVPSHDARKVAFSTGTALRVVPADGGAPTDVLTADPGMVITNGWSIAWSPDDKYLYFLQQQVGQSQVELLRVPANGGTPENTGLAGEGMRDMNISPDGTHIAFVRGTVGRPEIWTMENYLPRASK